MVYIKWLEKDEGGHHFGGTNCFLENLLQKFFSSLATFVLSGD
jgi:hypothetical protein